MTQLQPSQALLRDRLVSKLHDLDEVEIMRAAELLSPLIDTADDAQAPQADFDGEAWLKSIGLSVEEFMAIAEEGHASIQRGEGLTLEEILAEHRKSYPTV